MKKLLLMLAALACIPVSEAASSASAPQGKPEGDHAALEAAIKSCSSTVSKDSSGRPDMSAMDACMTGKGFKRPDGPPPGPPGQQPGKANAS